MVPMNNRYSRQSKFAPLGVDGQTRIEAGRVVIIGVGALGSVSANTLARAGVGFLRLVDRDFLEWNNLQRQVLYDEDDVRKGTPKAIAAARRLAAINSEIEIEPYVGDVHAGTITGYCQDVDVIIDGTDNFETRFLINDASASLGIPWVYGGCIGAEGQSMTIIPGETPCFRCLMGEGPPAAGTSATCDSAGILGPIVNLVASFQANEVLKLLSGNKEQISRFLTTFDIWDNRIRQLNIDALNRARKCPVCDDRCFEWLDGIMESQSAVLCGRNSVQVSPSGAMQPMEIDLSEIASRLEAEGTVEQNEYLLRFVTGEQTVTLFRDGRAIISGTEDISQARSIYARYIGS